ncbi:hypothetical protein AF72_00230 [Xylella taiwanensis]|uniref:Uncharacterized protein n=1 Tax=Xylella taiwanensis TaxID=1444770 RepID=Z9JLZ2_9GAMM|nr:hypothetical protein AF72_00230 [Xylella taiwanensis]
MVFDLLECGDDLIGSDMGGVDGLFIRSSGEKIPLLPFLIILEGRW